MTTPHKLLGLPEDATPADAARAYKRLAQKYHPDKPGGSVKQFQALGQALKDFKLLTPCVVCLGKGKVKITRGLGVKYHPCPKCWNT